MLTTNHEKARSLRLVYRNVEMRTTSSHSYGRGASVAYTGFNEFGGLVVKEAQAAFAERKVAIAAAMVLDGKEPILADAGPKGAGDVILPVLVIAPMSGETRSTGMATRTTHVFSAQLLDPQTRRMIWKATMDTSTWSGQDIVMKHVEKTLYDETYARQFLKAVANKMAEDGVI